MLSRIDFYDLEEDMKNIKIYELKELSSLADYFFTAINSIKNNNDAELRLTMLQNAEDKAREMMQVIITKINPDMNWIISLDGKQNDSYKKLTECLSVILGNLKKEKDNLRTNILNREFFANKLSNKINIDFYSSTLTNFVSSLIYNPIKEACFKFLLLEKTDESVTDLNENQILITGDNGRSIKISKGRTLFWFLVFSYLFRSSQVIDFFSQEGKTIPRTLDFREIQKIKQRQFQIEKSQIELQNRFNKEETSSDEDSKDRDEKNDLSDLSEEKNKPLHKEIKEKEKLTFLPKINGAEEQTDSLQEQEEFDEENLEDVDGYEDSTDEEVEDGLV